MDTSLCSDICKKLISGQVCIFLGKSHIVPGDVFGLKNIIGFHIGIGKPHRWEVVSKHNYNSIFTAGIKGRNQIADKIIYLMNHIYIIFPLVVRGLSSGTADSNCRILKNLLGRVIAVSLYGNRVYKIGLILRGV